MNIETIKDRLDLKYYKSIIKCLEKNGINNEWLHQHLENLTTKNIPENLDETVSEKPNTSSETDNYKQIFDSDNLYNKPWSKLNAIHKSIKIKEYVNSLKMNSEEERRQLKDELLVLIKTKVLTKKENVNYNENEGKILEIPKLQYKNGKYYYESA